MKANVYPGRLEAPDWNNIECLSRNRMPPHAYLIQFPDLATCRHAVAGNARYASPLVLMLNGEWNVARYPSVTRLPERIASLRAGFDRANIPSCWQFSGFGTLADGGAAYPFPVNPPRVPDDTPVAVYRRSLRLPLTFGGLRKRIVFQGVSSAFHLFVNGRDAGFSAGPGLPAEFDITNQLHDGDNELTIHVYGFSATSYLDAVPGPVMQGVFRDVYIEAVPPISVHDLTVRTSRVEDGLWRLEVEAAIISYRISTDSPIVRILLDGEEDALFEAESRVSLVPCAGGWDASPVQSRATALFTADLTAVQPWNAEAPVLHPLYVSVHDRQGHELGCVSHAVGFRECRSDGEGAVMLNDKPLNLFPVAWDGWHPQRGTALTVDDQIAAIRLMKRNNINAIVTGPLPPDPILFELCDIYGIYVIARLPIGFPHRLPDRSLPDDPLFLPACLERTRRLLACDRNFASIVAWTMAGDGIHGRNHAAMFQLAGQIDPSRPAFMNLPDPPADELDESEQVGNELFTGLSGNKNGSGETGVAAYWRRVFAQPWHDRGIGLNDAAAPWFKTGLVRADHVPYGSLRDRAQACQPIRIETVDAASGAFTFISRRSFTSTADLSARFLVLRDGLEILTGELDALRIEPGDRRFLELPFVDLHLDDGSEYLLRIEFEQAADTLHAPAGYAIGFKDIPLTPPQAPLPPTRPAQASIRLRLERERHLTILSGHRFYLVFNHVRGAFEACRNGDKELFCTPVALDAAGLDTCAGPQLALWRATTAADRLQRLAQWQAFGYDRLQQQVMSVDAACDGHTATIGSVTLLAAPGCEPVFRSVMRQDVGASGSLQLSVTLEPLQPGLPVPPRIGLRCFLRPEYASATFYGLGPQGSLSGQPGSRRLGIHRLPLAALAETAHMHQETGVHADVRYLKLQDELGLGLLVGSGDPFLFSARACSMEDLAGTPAGMTLPQRAFTEVILDCRHTPDDDRPAGILSGEPVTFAFTLVPIVV